MSGLTEISLVRLSVIFIPMLLVVYIHFRWKLKYLNNLYSIGRMLLQLMVIGYFLTFIFELNKAWIILLVLAVMSVAASVISMRNLKNKGLKQYLLAYGIIVLSGGTVLILATQVILSLEPWYMPRYFIPLAGMTFANTMNSLSITSERFESETNQGRSYIEARNKSYKAGLIQVTNSFLAVGLVSIPGMMTGQILSGVSPLIAARYQIMIMCMLYASSGIASAIYLTAMKNKNLQSEQILEQES